MKKNYCIYLLVMALAVMMSACSHDESTITDKLQQYISNDVDFVIAGDLEQMLQVTDSHTGTDGKVKLSDYMQKLIASMPASVRNNVSDVLDAEGFDWSTAVCGIHINGAEVQTLNIFSVKDEGDFADFFVEKYQFKKDKKDGFITLKGDDFAIAVRDNLAFFATSDDSPMEPDALIRTVNDWQSRAKSKKIDDWKCSYLDDGSVLTSLFNLENVCKELQESIDDADFWEQTRPQNIVLRNVLPEARNLIIGSTFNIKGLTATLSGKFFTQNGETYSWKNMDGKFNSSLLKYATDNDVAAIGVANASNITSMIGQSITGFGSEIISKWLKNFDGSLMLAVGVNTDDVKKIAEAPTNNLHLVLAIDCKEGKAQQALNTFATLIQFSGDARVTKHVAGSELQFSMATGTVENPALEPWEDGYYTSVYTNFVMKTDGNVLLLSNQDIDPTPVTAFTADMFKNKYALAVLNLPANSNLMKAIHGNFGADVRLSIEKSQFEAKITLSNSKKSFIEVLVDIMQNA